MNRLGGWIVLAGLVAACATGPKYPPLSVSDGQPIATSFQERLRQDAELSEIILKVTEFVPENNPFPGSLACDIKLDGKRWADLTRSQQNRVLQKIGVHLQAAFLASHAPTPFQRYVTARLYNDLLQPFGWVQTDGVNTTGQASR